MRQKRIMIAAPKSGSGKTMITCALLKALKNRGEQVVSYKCGPDYIDPMFHREMIGIPSKNLDTFFTGETKTRELFLCDRKGEECAVIEGVMGLFDGLGGICEEGSSYHLAKVTKTPIVLVIDAKGMGRSLLALLSGFLAYDTEYLIKGVILNRMSKCYYDTIKPLLEAELRICVLGYFPEQRELCVESRHLGLTLPGEVADIKDKVQAAAAALEETVSIAELLKIAEGAAELESVAVEPGELRGAACAAATESVHPVVSESAKVHPVIAVARDAAFCFYYEDNLRLLETYGAKLVYFSPLHDAGLPDGCNGILLGGGYPELYTEKLAANVSMLGAIRETIASGVPSVAECGGFMYLHETLIDDRRIPHSMVGAIPGGCKNTGKLVRFGYIEVEEKTDYFLPEGEKIKGHEFHYFDSTENGSDCVAKKPVTGKTYDCVNAGENHWWGFPHLYYPSNPEFARRFVKKAAAFCEKS